MKMMLMKDAIHRYYLVLVFPPQMIWQKGPQLVCDQAKSSPGKHQAKDISVAHRLSNSDRRKRGNGQAYFVIISLTYQMPAVK